VKVLEVIRELEREGWRQVRQKGSHRQFHHPTKTGTVTVAGSLGASAMLARDDLETDEIEWSDVIDDFGYGVS
jgi:hypothetical protein